MNYYGNTERINSKVSCVVRYFDTKRFDTVLNCNSHIVLRLKYPSNSSNAVPSHAARVEMFLSVPFCSTIWTELYRRKSDYDADMGLSEFIVDCYCIDSHCFTIITHLVIKQICGTLMVGITSRCPNEGENCPN